MPAEAPKNEEKKEFKAPIPVLKEDGTPAVRKGPAEIIKVYRTNHVEPKNPDNKFTEGCSIRIKPVGWKTAVNFNGFLTKEPVEGDKIQFSGELAQQTWTGKDGKEHNSHCIINGHGRDLSPEEFEKLKAEKEAFKASAKGKDAKPEAAPAEPKPAQPAPAAPEGDAIEEDDGPSPF